MPGFAKFLAVMNFLAAAAFVYLAAIDWHMRQAWSYEVFRAELVVTGLPVDDTDAGYRIDRSIREDLSEPTIQNMFKNAGGDPVFTQADEVRRIQEELREELNAMDDDAKRARLKQILSDQARTLAERKQAIERAEDHTVETDALVEEVVDNLFGAALAHTNPDDSATYNPGRSRKLIAHLLYNLSNDPNHHQRVMVVIGLQPFVDEAAAQAARLRDMAQQLRHLMVEERSRFESEYARLTDRIQRLANQVDLMKSSLANKADLKLRADVQLKKRQGEKVKLKMELAKAVEDTRIALEQQQALERVLFKVHEDLGKIKEQTEALERELRALEVRR